MKFRPYYERFLQGDLLAIAEYCDENAPRLDASFYELVGRLFFLRHYRAAGQVLSDVERGAGWIDRRKVYSYWYKVVLLPICQRARQFIQEKLASNPELKREELWCAYVPSLVSLGYKKEDILVPTTHLEPTMKEYDEEQRQSAAKYLLEWAESRKDSAGLQWRTIQEFSRFGLASRVVFFDLALTHWTKQRRGFNFTPAIVARHYACNIARVSESWASRKTVRK